VEVEQLLETYDNILANPRKYIHEKGGTGFMDDRAAIIYQNGLPNPIAAKLVPRNTNSIEYIDCIAKGEATRRDLGETYTAQRIYNQSKLAQQFLEARFNPETEKYESSYPAIKEIFHVY
jgi:hypothetical protein